MPAKTARIFTNGGSQAIRLPAEFRFEGDEVFVRRDERTGDVILSQKATWTNWREYFAQRNPSAVPSGFMGERPLNGPFKDRSLWDDGDE